MFLEGRLDPRLLLYTGRLLSSNIHSTLTAPRDIIRASLMVRRVRGRPPDFLKAASESFYVILCSFIILMAK